VVLEVTAKTSDGKEIYKEEKHYHPQATTCRDNKMTYGAQWKVAYIRDTSLQPYEIKEETFEIKLPKGVRTADVTADLFYELANPSQKFPIHKVTRKVSLDN
jgi:uncharacterized protein with von Willebrand factor type A (vWA) domain